MGFLSEFLPEHRRLCAAAEGNRWEGTAVSWRMGKILYITFVGIVNIAEGCTASQGHCIQSLIRDLTGSCPLHLLCPQAR